jgi:hypothetical protein
MSEEDRDPAAVLYLAIACALSGALVGFLVGWLL